MSETTGAKRRREESSFFSKYMQGVGLDIGFAGGDCLLVVPGAIGVDLDYPGYDGVRLPFPDESQDFVYSSHCLEHIYDPWTSIKEWYRVLRVDGYMIIAVPHQYLYEKKRALPSLHNKNHKRLYTPASLMLEIEKALAPNSYRVRCLMDCDDGYDYSLRREDHPVGEYQIELVIQKIRTPDWNLDISGSWFRWFYCIKNFIRSHM